MADELIKAMFEYEDWRYSNTKFSQPESVKFASEAGFEPS